MGKTATKPSTKTSQLKSNITKTTAKSRVNNTVVKSKTVGNINAKNNQNKTWS